MNDFRFAIRMLLKNPGFTAVAVLTLALGIGANTTIFAIVSVFFFEPLRVKDPHQLVVLMQKGQIWEFPVGYSYKDYRDCRERAGVFSDVIAYMPAPVHLGVAGQAPERTWIEASSGNYFSMLGVEPAIGRLFQKGEGEKVGADSVVVLAHDYWQRRFAGDPAVVGRTIQLNGRPFTVIGVTPASFTGANWAIAVKAWVPLTMLGQLMVGGEGLLENRGVPALRVMARMKPGVNLKQARAAMEVVTQQLVREYPDDHKQNKPLVFPETKSRPEPTFAELMPFASMVFMALAGLVLLIACANVANLMLSRALARQREMGIRTAIGASRRRLVQQLLAESVLLAVAAGVAGLFFAQLCGRMIHAGFTPAGDIPVRAGQAWDWTVFAFTFLISVVAGVATGLVPALHATKVDFHSTLKEGAATLAVSGRHLFRNLFVVSQVAVSLVVLVCAALFLTSLGRVMSMDIGFRTENLVMASIDLTLQGYSEEKGRQFLQQLIEKARAIPAVQSAALANGVPFDYSVRLTDVGPEGQVDEKKAGWTIAGINAVSSEYLQTMGIAVIEGRGFTDQDRASTLQVAVINATAAKRLWPGQSALGKRLRFTPSGPLREVVGVARDGKYVMLAEEPRPFVYVPLTQEYGSPITVHLRAAGETAGLAGALRQLLREMDPDLPIYNVRTMEQHISNSALAAMPLRAGATLAGVQGLLALLLALMGVYSVVAYAVSQRTREIGIRMALGARQFDILSLVIRESLRLTLLGIAIGLGGSVLMSRAVSRFLYGASPTDTLVYLGVAVLLAGAAAMAGYMPARRAARVDPVVALRCE